MTEPAPAINDNSWVCPHHPEKQHHMVGLMSFSMGELMILTQKRSSFPRQNFLHSSQATSRDGLPSDLLQ